MCVCVFKIKVSNSGIFGVIVMCNPYTEISIGMYGMYDINQESKRKYKTKSNYIAIVWKINFA